MSSRMGEATVAGLGAQAASVGDGVSVSDEVLAFIPPPAEDDVRGEVVLYRDAQGNAAIELSLHDGQVWLTQDQIATLYQTTRSNIARHLSNLYDEGEIVAQATCEYYSQVHLEGSRRVERQVKYYNLQAILAVGYRVRSPQGTQFRQWATDHLSEYLVKGFTLDDERLKNLGGGVYWRELLDRIRDIRASEKVFYRQVLDLFATSPDYDKNSEVAREFFSSVQNMFHFAVHGQTAAELVCDRVDADQPFMGVRSFAGEHPTLAEALIAKNYLDEDELQRLRLMVSAYFDAAELRAQMHQQTLMADWATHLTTLIAAMGGQVLQGKGKRTHRQMEAHVRREVARYRDLVRSQESEVERDYARAVKVLSDRVEGC